MLEETPQAPIAAVAIADDLLLFTRNPTDFTGIDGLTVVEAPLTAAAPPQAGAWAT